MVLVPEAEGASEFKAELQKLGIKNLQ